MNQDLYTERARGFVQSAQSLALRNNHQQLTPLHILKVLLDDNEGLSLAPDLKISPRSLQCRLSRRHSIGTLVTVVVS